MKKILRKLSVVIGFIILFGGLYISSKLGNSESSKNKKEDTTESTKRSNYVRSMIVKNETLASEVIISGKVIPRQKINLYSEVSGNLVKTGKEFREGILFKSGELMLNIETTEAELELQAAKSQLYSALIALLPDLKSDFPDNFKVWKEYIDSFEVNEPIKELPKTENGREKLYIGGKNIENQYINIKRQEYRLTKYKIYAPFDAVLSNASIYEGALVRSGQKLGELTHPSHYEVEATVSLHDVKFFRKGNKVKLYSEATKDEWIGTVARFGKLIDEKTQSQTIFITVNSSKLNEGMFLNGKITTKYLTNIVQLPRKLLINNSSVYTIRAGKLSLQNIDVIKVNNNQMYVQKLEDGVEVLAQTLLGAYEGMPVEIIK
ncbi:MAG: efflux RND transporter periplasmic adaptor subunit [Saprospiraceae bacterium]|nr:efflux RND transporter periplasmic adaptor subunit [Saprospiraceae bacterium]